MRVSLQRFQGQRSDHVDDLARTDNQTRSALNQCDRSASGRSRAANLPALSAGENPIDVRRSDNQASRRLTSTVCVSRFTHLSQTSPRPTSSARSVIVAWMFSHPTLMAWQYRSQFIHGVLTFGVRTDHHFGIWTGRHPRGGSPDSEVARGPGRGGQGSRVRTSTAVGVSLPMW